MRQFLSTYTNSKDNNFNLLRFIAASLVLFSHSFVLITGLSDVEPLRSSLDMSLGSIAVDIFFITSGFLITKSYISRHQLLPFIWARVLRIYPALIIALLLTVFGAGLYLTTLSPQAYLTDPQPYKYVLKTSILFFGAEYFLPGVFTDTPFPMVVNASLWTLPYEVKMYAILACIMSLVFYIGKNTGKSTIPDTKTSTAPYQAILFVISVLAISVYIIKHFYTMAQEPNPNEVPSDFIRFFTLFFIGSACYVWRNKICLSYKLFSISLIILCLSTFNADLFFVCYTLLLPYLILYIAYVPTGMIRRFNQIGDYSYGMYIYAFPVQQSIMALIPNVSITMMIVLSFSITIVLSVLSWHLVEKRCLSMKESYGGIRRQLQKLT